VGRCGGVVVLDLVFGLVELLPWRGRVDSLLWMCLWVVLEEVMLELMVMEALLVQSIDGRTSFEV